MLATQVSYPTALKMNTINFSELTPDERRELFIKATDHLKSQGVSFKTIAAKIRRKVPRMNYARLKNIRIDGAPNVKPSVNEIEVLFTDFEDRLSDFLAKIGEPTPEQKKMEDLEKRIKALEKEDRISRAELLRKIELLEAENELLKKKLNR